MSKALIAAIAVAGLAACGGNSDPAAETTSAAEVDVEAGAEETTDESDSWPIVEDEDGTVVFVEVKSRRGTAFGAAEAVTTKKLNTMRRCAAQWLDKHSQGQYRPIRFDVVEVVFDGEDYILRRFPGVEDGAC